MDLTPPRYARAPSSPLQILVVEDDARIRLHVADHLRQRGYEVLDVSSADEALALLSQGGGLVDCVFSDVQMPGHCDGVDLARWIFEHRPGLPVLLTSGSFRTEDLEPELRAVLPVLRKPYRAEEVERRLNFLAVGVSAPALTPFEGTKEVRPLNAI